MNVSRFRLEHGSSPRLIADIGELENKIGYKLPIDYVEFLKHANGGVSDEDLYFQRKDEIVLIKNFISFTGLDIDNGIYWEYKIFEEEMGESDLLPIAFDIGHQPICLALAPEDLVGTVVSIWECDEGDADYSVVKLADSFIDFCEAISPSNPPK